MEGKIRDLMTEKEFRQFLLKRLAHLCVDADSREDVEALAAFSYGYLFADEMVEYIDAHPEATYKELWSYFDENVPDGLAPDDDGLDLMEDD